jgi:hypothetical protein
MGYTRIGRDQIKQLILHTAERDLAQNPGDNMAAKNGRHSDISMIPVNTS